MVICGLDTCTSDCHGKILLLSPSLAAPREGMFVFSQTHMLLVQYRELFCAEMPFSCPWDLSGSFRCLPVEVEFVDIRRRFFELGKTLLPFLTGFLFLYPLLKVAGGNKALNNGKEGPHIASPRAPLS